MENTGLPDILEAIERRTMTHYYERNIVEIKNELTTMLVNILTPLIYEGIKAMYHKASEIEKKFVERELNDPSIKNPGVFKLFQLMLRDVPNLNEHNIEQETIRIKDKCKCSEYFDDLVKSVIKSNIVLLTFNVSGKKSPIIESKYHESIDIKQFIHKIYIECSREFFNNPQLFWHNYPTIEIKKNQREAQEVIKTCITNAIRKMLPVKLILEEYMKNDYVAAPVQPKYTSVGGLLERDLGENQDEIGSGGSYTGKYSHASKIIDSDEQEEIEREINNVEESANETNRIIDETTSQFNDLLLTSEENREEENGEENREENTRGGVKMIEIPMTGNKNKDAFFKQELEKYKKQLGSPEKEKHEKQDEHESHESVDVTHEEIKSLSATSAVKNNTENLEVSIERTPNRFFKGLMEK